MTNGHESPKRVAPRPGWSKQLSTDRPVKLGKDLGYRLVGGLELAPFDRDPDQGREKALRHRLDVDRRVFVTAVEVPLVSEPASSPHEEARERGQALRTLGRVRQQQRIETDGCG